MNQLMIEIENHYFLNENIKLIKRYSNNSQKIIQKY